ncbi:MAG: alpha/beta hydrolase [Magnetospirillum sp.]|nr:alpha/beta hydrolase [Magnetospirillum sp.]
MDHNPHGGRLPTGAGILPREGGASIAYRRTPGKSPGVVFFHGYRSDMNGTKALALEAYCRGKGYAFLRYDAFGHGASPGDLAQETVSRWAEDAVAVLDSLTEGPQVLVGSSLGGWIALLAALRRQERVAGIVGVAAAPDFTEDLMWAEFAPEQRREMLETGWVTLPNGYDPASPWRIARALIEDGRRNLLLRDAINLRCPVRLLQGQRDADVPWRTALRIAECLAAEDVEVLLVKDGDHRLSRPQDMERLYGVVGGLLDGITARTARR